MCSGESTASRGNPRDAIAWRSKMLKQLLLAVAAFGAFAISAPADAHYRDGRETRVTFVVGSPVYYGHPHGRYYRGYYGPSYQRYHYRYGPRYHYRHKYYRPYHRGWKKRHWRHRGW
jgi:hypothetical protein